MEEKGPGAGDGGSGGVGGLDKRLREPEPSGENEQATTRAAEGKQKLTNN
ncbi:hypothetical protein PC116_g8582 [Phytophthora cactorum]|uniref:Uncharacterized protein n=1 Tax=Phytophthora cactorum TaxID=29920 RepID=A0A8T1L3H1_9STRA|nr:hypothetical protein Pcac1_g20742 [Phytophthora cactorum]KAG2948619.1 hypothetical protein PC117_g5902 [Phytophthora cactorum]KAG3023474.1 hypothetical protein PC120_g7556 [Phytophthora cactorum]KAG3032696.1 hypothetical protein PC119_g5602 [Phytophthora cactorum]KAG3181745.1 hypothetical protein C6341_g6283 [Phytophthora cactorum]